MKGHTLVAQQYHQAFPAVVQYWMLRESGYWIHDGQICVEALQQ
jgi:membrane glycosyltransferase